ncbi:hypothetical protein [Thiohalocapsa sp. ML1]|jgi:hypothetical protein|uniref:hypothetical protein n=1 Tax=Thiohalocapsa sp. ML1 TaxID=1431688 RepID=UPI0007323913|nr:hypothetical protein [Thiohalocapsa sp. ML1]
MTSDESFEQLLCGLLFLLSRQVRTPSPTLPPLIASHLRWLSTHPGVAELPALRDASRRLARHWQIAQDQVEPAPASAEPAPRRKLH